MNNKPLAKFTGPNKKSIQVSIWATSNGGFSAKVEKRYKAKDTNEWKETKSFFPEELDELISACSDAKKWMHENKGDSRTEQHQKQKQDGYQPQPLPFDDSQDIPF